MQRESRPSLRRIYTWLQQGIITAEEAVYLLSGRQVRTLQAILRRCRLCSPACCGPARKVREE
ncbi:MAG: hypothetical protein GX036_05155 [Firmicutes bacterium]|jgi:hypothetical protein|nr:hypothetical protein [Bacillota bacterium]